MTLEHGKILYDEQSLLILVDCSSCNVLVQVGECELYTNVLVLAGTEFIFPIVASMGLCFGFVLKTVLITQDVLLTAEQGLHRVKAFPASYPTPPASGLGGECTRG